MLATRGRAAGPWRLARGMRGERPGRARWGHAAIALGLLALAIAWPRLAPAPPRLPSDAGIPVATPQAAGAGRRVRRPGGSGATRVGREAERRAAERAAGNAGGREADDGKREGRGGKAGGAETERGGRKAGDEARQRARAPRRSTLSVASAPTPTGRPHAGRAVARRGGGARRPGGAGRSRSVAARGRANRARSPPAPAHPAPRTPAAQESRSAPPTRRPRVRSTPGQDGGR